MAIALIGSLYEYHRWANRHLFDVAVARGRDVVEREMGPQWSVTTIRGMFAHIYGADAVWLARWKGTSLTEIPGGDLRSMEILRERWDAFEVEQAAFLDSLTDADAGRVIAYKNTQGQAFRAPLGPLVQHVVNHATHHRSEIATMLTLAGGSPPDTGINTFLVARPGRV